MTSVISQSSVLIQHKASVHGGDRYKCNTGDYKLSKLKFGLYNHLNPTTTSTSTPQCPTSYLAQERERERERRRMEEEDGGGEWRRRMEEEEDGRGGG